MSHPIEHGVRSLERQRREGQFDGDTLVAIRERVDELAADAGGRKHQTSRELALLKDAAVCDLIVDRVLAHVAETGSIFRDDGRLLPVIEHSLATFMNTKRLHLVAVGLRPDRANKALATCAHCGAGFTDVFAYTSHTCTAGDDAAEDEDEDEPQDAAAAEPPEEVLP